MPSRRSRPRPQGEQRGHPLIGGPALQPVPIPAWYKDDITQSSEGQESAEGQKSAEGQECATRQKSEGQKSEGQESAEGQKSAEGQESATRQT